MVRKRTRKYQSDDNDSDSDVDFGLEDRSRPAPKKYSLRERRGAPSFTSDYDYYGLDDEDGETKKESSDDEDFEVQDDTEGEGVRPYFEPDPNVDPENCEGLIDFEDIIRADIVVNRNRIDYDNVIQKTEIKLTQPKRRGRKPKNRIEETAEQEIENSNVLCTPELGSLSSFEPEEQSNVATEDDKKEIENTDVVPTIEPEQELIPNGELLASEENGDAINEVSESDLLVIKNSNGIDLPNPSLVDEVKEQKVEDEDDDVIVLGEIKQPVIVLDD